MRVVICKIFLNIFSKYLKKFMESVKKDEWRSDSIIRKNDSHVKKSLLMSGISLYAHIKFYEKFSYCVTLFTASNQSSEMKPTCNNRNFNHGYFMPSINFLFASMLKWEYFSSFYSWLISQLFDTKEEITS